MKVQEFYQQLEERIPRELSCEWDNDGLMVCGDPQKEVKRVLIALDVTAAVAEAAIAGGYDMILSHHPLVFRPLKAVTAYDPVAKKVIELIRANIAVASFHTRLDAVCGGVNDTLAAALGLGETVPFGNNGETIGRIGTLAEPMPLEDFTALVKRATGVPFVLAANGGRPVHRVAVLGGSGSSDVAAAERAGADTYLSGELAHHHLTDAPERGMNLVAAGHFHTENPVCERLKQMVLEIDPSIETQLINSNPILVL